MDQPASVVLDLKAAKNIASTFLAVHTSQAIRLARGASERKRVFDALRVGGEVQSYRYDWLQAAVAKCVGQMTNAAFEFNQSYQFDRCSVQDLIDVCEMAAEKLRKG